MVRIDLGNSINLSDFLPLDRAKSHRKRMPSGCEEQRGLHTLRSSVLVCIFVEILRP